MDTEKVLIKKSILTIDGKNFPVDLVEWGRLRLSGDDLDNFENHIKKLNAFLDDQRQQNVISVSAQYEDINKSSINTGVIMTRPKNFRSPMHDEFYSWVDRMQNDPCITVFNWEELIVE